MKYKKKVLKNGVRVLMIPMPESPTVTYMVWANAGSHHEEERENGISHFLEHMVFKGTKNYPSQKDIRKNLDGIGAYNNAFTSFEYTAYYAKSNPRYLRKIINVISDMYMNATIPSDRLQKEKGVILGEIDMYEDNPRHLAYNVWRELVFGNQPAGRTILGPKKNIKKFKRDDFIKYREKHYVASSTVAVVAGKFDENKAIKEIEKQFKNISTKEKVNRVKVKESQKEPGLAIKNKKTDQTHLLLSFRTLSMFGKPKELAILDILNTILGRSMSSRLWLKVREEMSLGYYIYSHTETFPEHGYIVAGAGIDNKRLKEAIRAILGEIKKLKKNVVAKDELDDAKRYFIGTFPMDLEQSDGVAEYYAHDETMGKKPVNPKDVYKGIEKVTAKQVQKMAQRIFRNNKMNLAIIGPHSNKQQIKKIFRL